MGRAREFCFEDEDGNRSDVELHESILQNEEADIRSARQTRERLIAEGHGPELMKQLISLPEDQEALRS